MRRFVQLCFIAVASCALCGAASGGDKAEDCAGPIANEDKKIAACTEVLSKDPNNATAYEKRGYAYWIKCSLVSTEFCAQAIADYTKAIELTPNPTAKQARIYVDRGDVYEKNKEHALAIADYTKAIELDPNQGNYWCQRGNAYMAAGDKALADEDFDMAEEAFADAGGGLLGRMDCSQL